MSSCCPTPEPEPEVLELSASAVVMGREFSLKCVVTNWNEPVSCQNTITYFHHKFIIIIISSMPAPRSSHQGMALAEEFPIFSIQTLPPYLLKVIVLACLKFLKNLSLLSLVYSCTLSLHFTGGRPLAFPSSISLTHIHPSGHLTLLHSLHVAKQI